MKLGIFLGTFDPVHNGHVKLAEDVLSVCRLDQVMLLPLNDAPHKSNNISASGKQRLEMCQLACTEGLIASDIELKANIYGYSLDMIHVIQRVYPTSDLYYILGSDVFKYMDTWETFDELIKLVHILVIIRDESDRDQVDQLVDLILNKGQHAEVCQVESLNLSSRCIKTKPLELWHSYIPPRVMAYIKKEKLYKNKAD